MDNRERLLALRAEAVKKHKNATNKISRNKTARGAEISGTQYDPRRELSKVRKYNQKQLEAYIGKLDNFTARSTQFVPDRNYRPIPKARWDSYKRAEAEANKRSKALLESISDTVLPSGMTIGEHVAMQTAAHPQMTDPASNLYAKPLDRDPRQVTSLKALDRLIVETRKRATPAQQIRLERANRTAADQMLGVLGMEEMRAELKTLNRKQFALFWGFGATGGANSVSLVYELFKKMLMTVDEWRNDKGRNKERGLESIIDSELGHIEKALEWAKGRAYEKAPKDQYGRVTRRKK